jgi:hypothetical protein
LYTESLRWPRPIRARCPVADRERRAVPQADRLSALLRGGSSSAFRWCRHVRSGRLARRCRDCRVRAECSHGGIAAAAPQTGSPLSVRRSIPWRKRPRDTGTAPDLRHWLANRSLGRRRRLEEHRPGVRRRQRVQRGSVSGPPQPRNHAGQRLQQVIERHLGDIDGEIKVAVEPGLTPNQCVDTPPAGNPDAVKPCPVSDTQHSPDIGSGHVPASVVTDVCHHEASQTGSKLSGTGWPTAQRSCRRPTGLRGIAR